MLTRSHSKKERNTMLTLFRRIRHVPKARYFTTTTDNETPVTNVSNEEDTFSIEDLPVSKVIFFLILNYFRSFSRRRRFKNSCTEISFV